MSPEEQYQWKEVFRHVEQMQYHKRIANTLLEGLMAHYNAEDKATAYEQKMQGVVRQALN